MLPGWIISRPQALESYIYLCKVDYSEPEGGRIQYN